MFLRQTLPVLVAVAVVTAGCGSSSTPKTTADASPPATSTGTSTSTTKSTSPVSVLGSSVAVTADRVDVSLRLRQPADADPPIARTAQLTLAKGIAWRGDKAPSCDAEKLERDGVDGCPPSSVIGMGAAIGKADTSKTDGEIVVVNGGKEHVYLATTVRHPAYVKTVVPGTISEGPDDSLRLDFTFPDDLQTIAGVPVGLQQLRLSINRGPALDVDKCPDDGWAYDATVEFEDETEVQQSGKASCAD